MNDRELENIVAIRFPGDRPPAARQTLDKPTLVATLKKLAALQMETLTLYMALPAVAPFHESNAIWRIAVGGNRSSKTTAGIVECARAFANCDPYQKYKPRDGKILCIGLDEKHLADPIGRKMFQPGAFKLIRDEITKLPRFLREDPNQPGQLDPYDAANEEKWFDAPPIIPPRLLNRQIAWKDRASGVPAGCTSIFDWTMEFRTSNSAPKQGDEIDLGHIDESIVHGQHFVEMSRGLVSRNGRGIWTATPQNVSHYLRELWRRHEKGDPNVFCVTPTIYDNFVISEARRNEYIASIPSAEERAIRIQGKFAFEGLAIYPMYDPQFVHGCEPKDVPLDSTRYVVLDPGRQHCATVFVAVDREEKHRYVYAAFEIRGLSSALEWATQIKNHEGSNKFEAFVIDGQAGAAHSMAGGPSIAEQFWNALCQVGVRPRTLGPGTHAGFFPSQRDVNAREEALRNWMAVRPDGPFAGTPILQVVRGCCPELDRQIEYACNDNTLDDKRQMDQPQDLCTCAEYAAAFNPCYHEPEPVDEDPSIAIYKNFLDDQEAERKRNNPRRYRMRA